MPGQTGLPRSGPAGWAELTARSLVETFEGSFETAGVVVAAACVDEAGAVIRVSPACTPADGRLEIGSVTKTMTATLLALLAADGTLRLEDEVGRFLAARANGGITLRQLATHTSGLPRIAPNFDVRQADLGHHGTGTEHLLLALFQDAESPAASTLAAFGMTHEDTTAKIQQARAAAAAEASRRETSQ